MDMGIGAGALEVPRRCMGSTAEMQTRKSSGCAGSIRYGTSDVERLACRKCDVQVRVGTLQSSAPAGVGSVDRDIESN